MRAEQVDGMPMLKRSESDIIQQALEAARVIFIETNGEGSGVRLRKIDRKDGEKDPRAMLEHTIQRHDRDDPPHLTRQPHPQTPL